jgi:hypothetical protein
MKVGKDGEFEWVVAVWKKEMGNGPECFDHEEWKAADIVLRDIEYGKFVVCKNSFIVDFKF